MRFSLLSALIATFVLAVVIAFISPALRPQPYYEARFGGGSTSWVKAEVRSSSLFRGNDIPTILIGEAKSKYISDLDGFRLPFAIILHDSNNEFIDFQSTLNNNSLNLSVTDKIQFRNLEINNVYSLTPNDGVSQITETMELDGVNIDLAKGRVVELTNKNNSYTFRQINPTKLDRTLFPNQPASTREQMSPIIDWWRQVRQDRR